MMQHDSDSDDELVAYDPFAGITRDDSLFDVDFHVFDFVVPGERRQPVGGSPKRVTTPASNPSPTPASKSGATSATKSGPTPATKSGPTPATKPGATSATKSGATSATKSGPTPASKPGPTPASNPGPTPAPDGSITFKPDYWFDGDAHMNGALRYITDKRDWRQMLEVSGGGTKQQFITVPVMRRPNVFSSFWDSYHRGERINSRNAWFQVRFLHHRLIVTHLQVALHRDKPNQWPHSWKLIASNNGREWVTIIEEKCTSTLKPCKERVPCTTVNIQPTTAYAGFRFVMMNGCPPGSRDDCLLSLSGFELYGRLLPV